ncbi:MAG: DUF4926 domain-containing protein [Saprospiraceae bacterium]
MNQEIKLLDVVALLKAMPAHHLKAGQVGTVVEVFGPSDFEMEFVDKQGRTIANWRRDWHGLRTFFQFGNEIRRLIYTTNNVEGVNRQIRKKTEEEIRKILGLMLPILEANKNNTL